MDSAVYVTANGADQIMLAMQTNNHNLANVNTIGFKADMEVFKSLPTTSDNLDTRIFSETQPTTADFRPGHIMNTERDLDVAISDTGWFVVQAEDGTEAYTRAGNFEVSAEGLLTTSGGLQVLGNGGPISMPPASRVDIANDGTISVVPIGSSPDTVVAIDRLKLVNPDTDDLQKGLDGLFHFRGDEPPVADANVKVISRALEGSNVNAVDALVNMLDLTRQYEAQMRLIQTLKQNDATAEQIMQIS